MKKFTLFLVTLLTVQVMVSQPVINSSFNLSIGDTYTNDGYDGITAIDPGPSGPNQTWDFSTITGGTFIDGVPVECVAPATTVFGDSAAALNANICVKNESIDGMYQYIKATNTYQDYLAIGFYETGGSSFNTYKDILRIMELPFSYGESFTDDYANWMYSIDMGNYIMADSGTVVAEADAYGSVTTPTGITYNNTLRIKKTTTSITWIYANGIWFPGGGVTIVNYSWYSSGLKVPVISISYMDGFPEYSVMYLTDHNFNVGIEEQSNTDLHLFPNPTNNYMTIRTNRGIDDIEVYSITGKQLGIVLGESEKYIDQTIDLSGYPTGVYFMEIRFSDGDVGTKRIIKK